MKNNYLTYSLFIPTIFIVGFLIWVSNKGFDISDESYYFLGYYHKITPVLSPSLFHKIYNIFFGYFSFSLVQVRLLRIVLTIASSTILWLGVSYLFKHHNWLSNKFQNILLFNLILIGSFISYSWAPLAISYNSFSLILLNITIGLWFYNIIYKKKWLYFILGILLGLIFFNKISNFLLLFTFLPLATFLWEKSANEKIKNIISTLLIQQLFLTIGIMITIVIIINPFDKLNTVSSDFLLGLTAQDGYHTLPKLLEIYINNFLTFFKNIYVYGITIILFYIICFFLAKRLNKKKLIEKTCLLFSFLSIGYIALFSNYYHGGTPYKYTMFEIYFLILLNLILYISLRRQQLKLPYQKIIFLFFMICLLFIGSLGTSNGLTAQFLFYMSFFSLIVFIFILSLQKKGIYLFYFLIVSISLSQITSAVYSNPYRQCSNLKQNTFKIPTNQPLSNLYTTKSIINLNKDLSFIKNNNNIKYCFTFRHQIGINLLIDKIPYPFGWLIETNTNNLCNIIRNSKNISEQEIVFIIPSDFIINEQLILCLKSKNINFPYNFTKIKSISFKNCSTPNQNELDIYVYKK